MEKKLEDLRKDLTELEQQFVEFIIADGEGLLIQGQWMKEIEERLKTIEDKIGDKNG